MSKTLCLTQMASGKAIQISQNDSQLQFGIASSDGELFMGGCDTGHSSALHKVNYPHGVVTSFQTLPFQIAIKPVNNEDTEVVFSVRIKNSVIAEIQQLLIIPYGSRSETPLTQKVPVMNHTSSTTIQYENLTRSGTTDSNGFDRYLSEKVTISSHGAEIWIGQKFLGNIGTTNIVQQANRQYFGFSNTINPTQSNSGFVHAENLANNPTSKGFNYLCTAVGPVNQRPQASEFTCTPLQSGKDGADGVDGTNGTDGADGANGANGADGKDGVDGANPHVPHVIYLSDSTYKQNSIVPVISADQAQWMGITFVAPDKPILSLKFNDFTFIKIKADPAVPGSPGDPAEQTYFLFWGTEEDIDNKNYPPTLTNTLGKNKVSVNPSENAYAYMTTYVGEADLDDETVIHNRWDDDLQTGLVWIRTHARDGSVGDQGPVGPRGLTWEVHPYFRLPPSKEGVYSPAQSTPFQNVDVQQVAFIVRTDDSVPLDELVANTLTNDEQWVTITGKQGTPGDKGEKGDKGETGGPGPAATVIYSATPNPKERWPGPNQALGPLASPNSYYVEDKQLPQFDAYLESNLATVSALKYIGFLGENDSPLNLPLTQFAGESGPQGVAGVSGATGAPGNDGFGSLFMYSNTDQINPLSPPQLYAANPPAGTKYTVTKSRVPYATILELENNIEESGLINPSFLTPDFMEGLVFHQSKGEKGEAGSAGAPGIGGTSSRVIPVYSSTDDWSGELSFINDGREHVAFVTVKEYPSNYTEPRTETEEDLIKFVEGSGILKSSAAYSWITNEKFVRHVGSQGDKGDKGERGDAATVVVLYSDTPTDESPTLAPDSKSEYITYIVCKEDQATIIRQGLQFRGLGVVNQEQSAAAVQLVLTLDHHWIKYQGPKGDPGLNGKSVVTYYAREPVVYEIAAGNPKDTVLPAADFHALPASNQILYPYSALVLENDTEVPMAAWVRRDVSDGTSFWALFSDSPDALSKNLGSTNSNLPVTLKTMFKPIGMEVLPSLSS